MVRSIQIFAYDYPLGIGEVYGILSKIKEVPYTKKDKIKPMEEIDLTATLSNVKKTDSVVTGYINYQYQHVIYKDTDKERDFVLDEGYNFLISSTGKCLIVIGGSTYRSSIPRLLSGVLHGKNEKKSGFSKITISKEKMHDLVFKIKEYDLENDVERPNFEFIEKKYQNLDDMTYAQIGMCITNHKLFKAQYPIATYWSPKMQLRKCNGILDDAHEPKVGFNMGKFAEFSLTTDAPPKGWYRFVLETCKSVKIF